MLSRSRSPAAAQKKGEDILILQTALFMIAAGVLVFFLKHRRDRKSR